METQFMKENHFMLDQSFITGKMIPGLMKDETLPQLLSASFQQCKDKTAFIFNDRSITYKQLDNWSNAVAVKLQQMGVQAGDSVGVWYPRSLELPVAILGILKAGAAYVPLDREMPQERIQQVFTDINVKTYFSDADAGISCPPISIPLLSDEVSKPFISPASSKNWAYVLFTSGSTGNPKGIPISHSNICHLIRAENSVLQLKETDIVYQGFSVSFDMWCEEVWISLFAGATIWIADALTVKAIDELSTVLVENNITILHAVPSILAIIDEVPGIRLVNAGGEACTPQVLKKWATRNRTFYNSYGPTETSVTSNMALLKDGDAISIGNPLPNYNIAVIDEQLNIVPRGERGEMIISGPGVSNGYFKLPELTAEKFLKKPKSLSMLPGETIYKTGDAVIIHENGFIEFQGRIDDQIKLRGYRIEPGEIESRINQTGQVSAAAVTIKKDSNGQNQLVGYVTMNDGSAFNEDDLRNQLAQFVAPYMVPMAIVEMPSMPRMPSGKIDKKKLPIPPAFLVKNETDAAIDINESDSVAQRLIKTLHIVFPGKTIDLQKDFFTDLGGHSLLAATLVSQLRNKAGLTNASLKDVYEHRPLQAFAAILEKIQSGKKKIIEPFNRVSSLQYYLCNLAQTVSLFFLYGLLAIQIFFPYLGYYYFAANDYGHIAALFSAFLLYTLIPPVFSIFILIAKWMIVGKFKEGDYPLWGWYYFRWWLWQAMKRLLPSQFIVDTPLYPKYLRMLGAKIKPSAQLSLLQIGAEDLLTIDDNVSTSSGCVIDNATVENGWLKLRKVHLKANAYMGSSSVVCGDTLIDEYGELQDMSCLLENENIGYGEVWNGSPAVKINKVAKENLPAPNIISVVKRSRYSLLYFCTLFIFPLVVILPLFPTLYIFYVLDESSGAYNFTYLWESPLLSASYIILFIAMIAGISRLLNYNFKPGIYSVYSFTYYKKWFKDQLMNLSLIVIHPIYATIYAPAYYRLLGAKVGRNSEISTASDVTHSLLEIGENSFIADAVILGEHEVRNQQLILEKTIIGSRSFVGNSGLIPQGYTLGNDMLIGVLSKPPTLEQLKNSHEKDWFGSPPIGLPQREKNDQFDPSLTFKPSLSKKIARGIVEAIRIILPQTLVMVGSVLLIAYVDDILEASFLNLLVLLPIYYMVFIALPGFIVTILFKWILAGKYKRTAMPMYSLKVWLSEAVTTFYEALSVPFLLDQLRGTMWLPLAFRLLGVKTGKRVWLNTTDITEFDMVSIGDEAMLNEDCGPQTHLFEDRIMKIGSVKIGSKTTIGSRTIILYDTIIGDHVNVGSLSLVMKGEELPDHTEWTGSPVKPL